MGERRTLVDGLDTIEPGDRTVEEQFVYGKKAQRSTSPAPAPKAVAEPEAAPVAEAPTRPPVERVLAKEPSPLLGLGRVPVGARIRTELAVALKRARRWASSSGRSKAELHSRTFSARRRQHAVAGAARLPHVSVCRCRGMLTEVRHGATGRSIQPAVHRAP